MASKQQPLLAAIGLSDIIVPKPIRQARKQAYIVPRTSLNLQGHSLVIITTIIAIHSIALQGSAFLLQSRQNPSLEVENVNITNNNNINDFNTGVVEIINDPSNPNAVSFSGPEDELRNRGLGSFGTIRPDDNPETAKDIIRKANDNELSSEMFTNKTKAFMSCETGKMVVKLNFSEPFRGVAYADYDKQSACNIIGDGDTYYELRLPLKGCGTKEEAPRLFVNNIIIRFHRTLEFEDDEVKTVVCRYPPPTAPAPPPPPIVPPAKM